MIHTSSLRRAPRHRRLAAATLAALLALTVTACAPAADGDATPTPPVPPTATPSASPTPTGPTLVADGTASDNLPLFRQVMEQVWATEARVQGRAYVDALVAAGFAKGDMEVTADQTTVGNPADAIQFSVRWGEECLVGQVGPSTPAPTAVVLPLVPDGTCLIGNTRPIDW
jgi:hypothetical protein